METINTNDMNVDIERIKRELRCLPSNEMDSVNWGWEEGVLITGNEAKLFLSLLQSQPNQLSDEEIDEKSYELYPTDFRERVKWIEGAVYVRDRTGGGVDLETVKEIMTFWKDKRHQYADGSVSHIAELYLTQRNQQEND